MSTAVAVQQANKQMAIFEQRLGKCSHGNDIYGITRQLPITTTRKLLKAVFSVGFALRLYSEDPRPAE
jgi:hypothetical protein